MLKLTEKDLPKYIDDYGNITFYDDVFFEGHLYCSGMLRCFGHYFVVRKTMYWSHISTPRLPSKFYIKLMMPPSWQRKHYQQRLGFELHGCYDEIRKKVGRNIFKLLKDDKWLPVERLMLESIRDYDKTPPAWVLELNEPGAKTS